MKIGGHKTYFNIIHTSPNEKKSESFEFLNVYFTKILSSLQHNQREVCHCHFTVFFHIAITLEPSFFWLSPMPETSQIFLECFLVVKSILIYAKILLSTKMSMSLQKKKLKIIQVTSHHRTEETCQQNWCR